MTLQEELERRIAESIRNDKDPPRVIARLICRYTYALGFVKGVEGGKTFPNDTKSGTVEEGLWFASYALAEPFEQQKTEEAA